jgi:hypothetical protein
LNYGEIVKNNSDNQEKLNLTDYQASSKRIFGRSAEDERAGGELEARFGLE